MPADPDEARVREIEYLHRDVLRDAESMVERAELSAAIESVNQRIGKLGDYAKDLERLHSRGFIWTAEIEAGLAPLEEQGEDALKDARKESRRGRDDLKTKAEALLRKAHALQPSLALAPAIEAIGQDRDVLEKLVEAAEERIEALTQPFCKATDAVGRQLRKAHTTMDRFEAAELELQPGENPFAAVEAIWEDRAEGKSEGMLLLTDLRLRFEGLEKIAKKKFLFITTESETVRKLLLDAAIGHITSAEDSKRGMVMKDQLLTLQWTRDAGVRGSTTTVFELEEGTAADWDRVIEEIRSGAIQRLRTGAGTSSSGAPAGTPVSWPEKCAGCSAPLPAPVKGMTSLACPYCSHTHVIELA